MGGCTLLRSTHCQVSPPSQSHIQPVTPAYTSGQPSTSSEPVPVADVSSAVIGLSVTVAMVIVISVIIVIVSLAVIIVLCQRQGMIYCTYVCDLLCKCGIVPCSIAALYRVKESPPKEFNYQMEEIKEVKLESNPAYEAVNTS